MTLICLLLVVIVGVWYTKHLWWFSHTGKLKPQTKLFSFYSGSFFVNYSRKRIRYQNLHFDYEWQQYEEVKSIGFGPPFKGVKLFGIENWYYDGNRAKILYVFGFRLSYSDYSIWERENGGINE